MQNNRMSKTQVSSNKLPAFRIVFDDGDIIETSMAAGITLEQAKAYYIGQPFVKADERTFRRGVSVEQIH
tara:strand:+ start:183766 stop:183975 length:210 start_codon:yes stop_codon:yes gene_type:complete